MFSHFEYLIVYLDFPHLVFGNWNFFLIAPFPDHCLLLPLIFKLKQIRLDFLSRSCRSNYGNSSDIFQNFNENIKK